MTSAPAWLDTVDRLVGACEEHGRPDLAFGLRRKRARLLDPTLRVQVVGRAEQGKSQLVNALVNAPVCPVEEGTGVTTVVHHAAEPSAVLVSAQRREPVPIERVGELAGRHGVQAAEIGIPRTLLARGVVLVDSPPEARPHECDVVVLATDATTELSPTELDLLRDAGARCPELVVALTKIDIAPRWRQAAQAASARLAGAGVPATVIPVSAELRLRAAAAGDQALNDESGFGELVQRLHALASAKSSVLAPRAAALAVRGAVGELSHTLSARIPGPTGVNVEELRRQAARCQTALGDEMADLAADLDYDLRDRARRILREVDRAFETADPMRDWPRFEGWLRDSLADAAEAHFDWLVRRCAWIADRVADRFPVPCEVPPGFCLPGGDHDLPLDPPLMEPFTLGQKAFTGLRGSYGGVLMFGLVTSLTVGLPLISPISVGAGVLFGARSVKEEGDNRLRRRQAAARAAAQRHVDDFFLRFGKDCRDAARQVHRGLRDHFAELSARLLDDIAATGQRHLHLRGELARLIALDATVTRPAELA